ncbi:MAG TPA: hypothetical protein VFE36_02315 [Candidatus Baltobacteraceae bacterium]|jgi:photosystem II stability/assembly factor-like uncharacterized protein|nr:hypothetical protein [Candidatus Baltobacteraceae bacterium]
MTVFAAHLLGVIVAVVAAFGNLQYRSIGPAIAGGRATAVTGSDRNPLLYYAGGAGGGVFKSVDGGASWGPVFDRERVAPIGAIAISPRDDADVWVGTGESNPRNDVEGGDGIWHTTDAGKTWRFAGLAGAGQISRISVDPRDPRTVVVGVLGKVFADSATRGAYVTHDSGAHWQRTLYVGPSSGISDLVRLPGKPETLFAGVYQFRRQPWMMTSGGPNGGIYRSDNGGTTWRRLTGSGLPAAPTGRIGLAAASGGRIYAIVQSRAGELWRSDDGGSTWNKMPHSRYVGDRSFYFSRIFVDPQNRNRLIDVGLILSRSDDGGKSFHAIATNAGWDYHQAWWSQDGRRVVVANDEGIVMSGDDSAHWWQPYDVPFAQPYHIGLGATAPNYRVCAGLQDDDTWCGWSEVFNGIGILNRDWSTVGPGDGMWALEDPTDSHLIWSTTTNSDTGQVYLFDERTQQASELSPFARSNSAPPNTLKYRFNWDSPLAFTVADRPSVLVGGNVVFESADRGQTWTAISPDLTRNDKSHQQASGGPIDLDISGAETSDTILDIETTRLDPAAIWVGTDDGLVQLTRDGGTHWKNVTPPQIAQWGRFSTVTPGHFDAGTAYAAYDRHMLGDDRPYAFATEDYGATWRAISGDLPSNVFLRVVREDPKDRNLLYAGSQRGVWVSFDRGAHWQSLRLNMPPTAVYDLEIQPKTDDLVVAAHGRGVWILDDLQPLRDLAKAQASAVTLVAPREAYRMFNGSPVNAFPCCGALTTATMGLTLPDNVYVGENPKYAALINYYLSKPAAHRPTIEIVDAHDRVVRHLSGNDVPNVAGINRTGWDIAEDGPVKWYGTFKENQGPDAGAESLPGAYTVRLRVDGRSYERPLTVLADPRDGDSVDRYVKRYAFLHELFAELSRIDTWLNAIDARVKSATPAQAAALRAFASELSSSPRNVEDLAGATALRNRIGDMLARVGTSFQAPNGAQLEEGADIKAAFDALSAKRSALGIP